MGKEQPLNGKSPVNFEINEIESKVFLLENGDPWGYYIVPENPPANWKNGFIFVQIAVNDFRTECIDKETGEMLDSRDCNPMLGDTVKRYGTIDEQMKQKIVQMLESFSLEGKADETSTVQASDIGIQIDYPQPQSVVNFPLEVRGEAHGSWYFEAEFGVALEKDGNTLSTAIVKAQGDWMKDDLVPFRATLPAPDKNFKEEARLVFRNSNASGKPENDKSYEVLVVMPGK